MDALRDDQRPQPQERRYVNVTPAEPSPNVPGFPSPTAWVNRISVHPTDYQVDITSRLIRADYRSRYLPTVPKDVDYFNARHGWREFCQSQHGIRTTGKVHLRATCTTLNCTTRVWRFTNAEVDTKGTLLVCKVCMDNETYM